MKIAAIQSPLTNVARTDATGRPAKILFQAGNRRRAGTEASRPDPQRTLGPTREISVIGP